MAEEYKYFAFISYNSQDQEWGKRLQQKLEHYRMPATLCSEYGWERKPLKPVFFAPTDIQPGALTAELQQRLRASRNLIVICSPNSAQSEWVGKEITFFHQLGRAANIHFFIVDGIPHSGNPETECFNPVIKELGLPEILGANIHEHIYRLPWLNRERAYVQLISKLLGVEYDTIWQRHRRLLVRKSLAWSFGILAVVLALLTIKHAYQSFDMIIRLDELSQKNDNLPPMHDAIVSIALDNETKTDTIPSFNAHATFSNIPHRFMNHPVQIHVYCPDYLPVDTTLLLDRELSVGICRDPRIYGSFRFRLWDNTIERTFPGAEVTVEGHLFTANDSGYLYISLPLNEQKKYCHISCSTPFVNDSLPLPTSPDAIIIVNK